MVVLYKPGAGFSLTYPAKEKDEASFIDCTHYFARWLGYLHLRLVCMNGEKAGAGASFESWLRGDGSPGLHPIEYHQGPPYVGKGLQALVERCIRSNREGVALLITDPNHRFPLAVIHFVAMEERWGYSCAFYRTVGGIPFTLTFRRAPPELGDTAVVSMPSLGTELRGVHPEYLQTVPDNLCLWGGPRFDQDGTILLALAGEEQELRILDSGKLLQGRRGAQALATADGQISSTEAQASASLPSSSALPSALPPSLPPPAPAEPSEPSPAQAKASVREAGAAGARPRSLSPAVSNRASVDSGESPLLDFIVPLGSLMKGTILDPSGPGVLRTPGTVWQHTRAPSQGRKVKDLGPVFFDKKGKRLLGADGEPLGYNWKVPGPPFFLPKLKRRKRSTQKYIGTGDMSHMTSSH
uniref:Uncharacterized protein n=1 Tax=Chromera velia CCMP2878 TaxID=1169474 RepID=A0A0G4HHN7_9ALVE|eukprot:Cvel_1044.t1-p1 / transcript=Cvel_1044.t1 / gene=Cvel_1044 / organism=Chromera_velia_CCMP2878 / gene_product=hypothetical protein / transcript_product=hypothetical protein / location=Cvel_scaffold34:8860-10391(+) / protein_length=411 / sequence_SO=supercontig / SO=protein_coding / is_pseudo=false